LSDRENATAEFDNELISF